MTTVTCLPAAPFRPFPPARALGLLAAPEAPRILLPGGGLREVAPLLAPVQLSTLPCKSGSVSSCEFVQAGKHDRLHAATGCAAVGGAAADEGALMVGGARGLGAAGSVVVDAEAAGTPPPAACLLFVGGGNFSGGGIFVPVGRARAGDLDRAFGAATSSG